MKRLARTLALPLRLLAFAAIALVLAGCSVTKIEYNSNAKGETSYKIYRNGHWLKTEADTLRGGMAKNGSFEFSADGLKSSPSEEFNRTMQTYTGAFLQLAAVAMGRVPAAAAGVPAAVPSMASGGTGAVPSMAATNAVGCADGSCGAPK